jgi:hypothetical protein
MAKDPDPKSKPRRAWHVLMAFLLAERKPSGFELFSEIPLSKEPIRMDYLLLRRTRATDAVEQKPAVFRSLWEHLPQETILEFKSASRPASSGDLDKLLAYGHLRKSNEHKHLHSYEQLALVMVVHHLTPTLRKELSQLGFPLLTLCKGYYYLQGTFRLFVIELAVVAHEEMDSILAVFDPTVEPSRLGQQWMFTHVAGELETMSMEQMEDFDEILDRLTERFLPRLLPKLTTPQRLAGLAPAERMAGLTPEERLAGMPPEERLAGLAPEERLAGLAPKERLAGLAPEERLAGLDEGHSVLALPIAILRGLSPTYLETLPEDVQTEVKRRLANADPV